MSVLSTSITILCTTPYAHPFNSYPSTGCVLLTKGRTENVSILTTCNQMYCFAIYTILLIITWLQQHDNKRVHPLSVQYQVWFQGARNNCSGLQNGFVTWLHRSIDWRIPFCIKIVAPSQCFDFSLVFFLSFFFF